ncbi:MAG: hypothetical protein WD512_18975 [Candidatus Paceibacterota bacterium]
MSDDWEVDEWETFERDVETIIKEIDMTRQIKNIDDKELSIVKDLFNDSDEIKSTCVNNKATKAASHQVIKKNTHKFTPINSVSQIKQIQVVQKNKNKFSLYDEEEDANVIYYSNITDKILNK